MLLAIALLFNMTMGSGQRFLSRRGFCVANVPKINVLPRVCFRVRPCVREKRTFHRSQRARVTSVLPSYTLRSGKARFWDLQFFTDGLKSLPSFFKKFFINTFLSFIYPSQKSRLTHFVTKRVLVDTDKTLIISYF